MRRTAGVIALLAVTATACGGGSGNLAIVGSSPSTIGVGPQRLVMAEVDPESTEFLGGPDETATAVFTSPEGDVLSTPLEWVWSIEGARGFLIARPTFEVGGSWTVAIESPRGVTEPTPFTVNADVPLPEVGDAAPRSASRTLDDHPIDAITTDPEPDPALYALTVAEAVGNGTPALIAFATPAFCQTAVCGPTLDIVKEVAARRSGFDAVHVEVFENVDSDGAGRLIEVPTVREWGLPSEPWIYVTDADGVVVARFEGAVSAAELEDALDRAGA